ncbi:unnamed protein product [Closterium sp. NIES-53]
MEGHVSGNIVPLFTSRAITSIWHDVLLFPEIAGAQSGGDDGGGVGGTTYGATGSGTCTFVCTAGSDANRDANGNASQQSLFSLVTRRRKLLLDGRVVPLEIPPSDSATASPSAKTISGFPAALTASPRTPKSPTTPKARSAAFPISNSISASGCGGASCPLTPTQYAPLVSWNSGVLPQTCLLAPCTAASSRAASDGTASAAAGADRLINATAASAESATSALATAPSGDDDNASTPFFDYAPADAIEIGSQVREPGDAYAVFPLLAFPVRPYRSVTNAAGRSSAGGRDGDDEALFGDADVSHKLLVIAADDPLIVGTRCNGESARNTFRNGSYVSRSGTVPVCGSVTAGGGGLARRIAEVIQWVQQSGFTTVPGRYENGLFRGVSQSISAVRFSPFSQREAQAVILHAHVAWKLLYSTLRRPANLDRTATMVRRSSRVNLPSPQPHSPTNSASVASAAKNAEVQPQDENSEDENQLSASTPTASNPNFSRSGASNFASNISRRITGSLPRGAGRKGATLAASPESQPQPEPQQQQQQLARLGGSANTRSNRLNNFLDSAPAAAAAAAAAAPAAAAAAAASVASAAAASAASAALSASSKLQAARAKLTARISNSQRALESPCSAGGGGCGGGGGSGWRPRSACSFNSDLMHLMALPAMSPASAIFTPAFDPPPPEIEGLCEAVEEEQQQLQRAILKQERLQKQQQLRLQRQQQAERQRQQLLERGGEEAKRAPVRLLILDDVDTDDEEEEEKDEFSFDAETPGVRSCGSGRGGDGGAAFAGTRGLERRLSGKSGVSEPSPRSTIGPYFQSISIQSTCSPESSDVESGEGAKRRYNQAKGRGFGDSGGSESGSAQSAHTSNEDGDFIDEDYNEDEDENGDVANPTTRFARTISVNSCPVTVVESWGRKRTPRIIKRVGSDEDLKAAGERAGARGPLSRAAVISSKAPTVKWLRPKNDAAASDQQEGGRLGQLIGRASTTGKEAATEIAAAALRALRKGGSEGTNGGGGKAGRPLVSPRMASGSKGMWDAGSSAGSGAVPPAIALPASAAGDVSRGNKRWGKGSEEGKRSLSGPLQPRLGAGSKNGAFKSLRVELESTQEQESDGGYSPEGAGEGGQTRLRRMAALPLAAETRPKANTEQTWPRFSGWKGSKSANSSLKAPESDGESGRAEKLSKKHLKFSPAEFGSATRIVLPWEAGYDPSVKGSTEGSSSLKPGL